MARGEIEPFEQLAKPSSRRSFLRKLGTFVAVGVGAVAVPGVAKAQSGRCCPSTCKNAWECSFPTQVYTCDGCGSSCCVCIAHDPYECFNLACPCGP